MPAPQPIVIFGTGPIAKVITSYIDQNFGQYIGGYIIDREYWQEDTSGLDTYPFDDAVTIVFPPDIYKMLIITGYNNMNTLREQKYHEAKEMGYSFANYIDSTAIVSPSSIIGNNVIISPRAIVEPFARIGNGVIIRPGSLIGHNAIIENFSLVA